MHSYLFKKAFSVNYIRIAKLPCLPGNQEIGKEGSAVLLVSSLTMANGWMQSTRAHQSQWGNEVSLCHISDAGDLVQPLADFTDLEAKASSKKELFDARLQVGNRTRPGHPASQMDNRLTTLSHQMPLLKVLGSDIFSDHCFLA